MITCQFMGRLGNQLFQAATTIGTAIKYNTDWYLPNNNEFNLPNIENRKINYLWHEKENHRYENIPNIDGLKLIGYFQKEQYFIHCKNYIINLFTKVLKAKTQINNDRLNNTCSIHIRRGDYLNLSDYHTNLDISYYNNAIKLLPSNIKYFIFSDDINWCKSNLQFANCEFVENNNEYADLYLMSLCQYNIIANSSFSWWGAYLNTHPNKKVILPNNWFGIRNKHIITDGLYCDGYIRL